MFLEANFCQHLNISKNSKKIVIAIECTNQMWRASLFRCSGLICISSVVEVVIVNYEFLESVFLFRVEIEIPYDK